MALLPSINILVTVHLDDYFGTYQCAGGAPGALSFAGKNSVGIACSVELFGQLNAILGTKRNAKLTALAHNCIDDYRAFDPG